MIQTIIDNKDNIIKIVTGVITIATVIATMTPNDSDNKIIKKILDIINAFGFNFGKAKNK
jgi:hypothetical protein